MVDSSQSLNQLVLKVRRLVLSEQDKFIKRIGAGLFGTIHLPTVVRLSKQLLKTHPEADKKITILGAWLHDSGHIWGGWGNYPDNKQDHAVTGEIKAREILKDFGVDSLMQEKVCHIVRSHRNRDVAPNTIEAKIVAAADSGAHFYGGTYENILNHSKGPLKEKAGYALDKLERDWRDVSVFPELAEKLKEKYEITKKKLENIVKQS